MRIIKRIPREGIVEVYVENLDDLWHLYNVVLPGDTAGSLSYRRDESVTDKIREKRGEKKKMYITLSVEKVEFHDFADRLRLHGVISEAPRDTGSYHTLNVEVGTRLKITKKNWGRHHMKLLEEAEASAKRPSILFISLDDEECLVATARSYGIQQLATIRSSPGGKFYREAGKNRKMDYFGEILEKARGVLAQMHDRDPGTEKPEAQGPGETAERPPVVVLGPGFTKEEFQAYLKEKDPGIFRDMTLAAAGQAGMGGIREAMVGNMAGKLVEEHRISRETRLVDVFLSEVSKGRDMAVYGEREIAAALEAGAVESLLVTDEILRKESNGTVRMLRKGEETGASIHIISTSHDAGKQLASIGGAGALLRYRI